MGAPSRSLPRSEHGIAQDRIRSQPRSLWQTRRVRTADLWLPPLTSFSQSQRTLLLFVIRDHIGATPLANLQTTLSQDMNRIWDNLAKPPGLMVARLDDYFDMAFETLPHKVRLLFHPTIIADPHKVLMPDKFESAVADLRKRFTGEDGVETYFRPAYHKRIPADGVSHYMDGIWVRGSRLADPTLTLLFAGTSPVKQGPGSPNATRTPRPVPLRRDWRCSSRRVQRRNPRRSQAHRSRKCRRRAWETNGDVEGNGAR